MKFYRGFILKVVGQEGTVTAWFSEIVPCTKAYIVEGLNNVANNTASIIAYLESVAGKDLVIINPSEVAGEITGKEVIIDMENIKTEGLQDYPLEIINQFKGRIEKVPLTATEKAKIDAESPHGENAKGLYMIIEKTEGAAIYKFYQAVKNADKTTFEKAFSLASQLPGVKKFNINGYLFMNETIKEMAMSPNQKEKQYQVVVKTGYPSIKYTLPSVFECQKAFMSVLAAQDEADEVGGNVYWGDDYIGYIDQNGRFYDKELKMGIYSEARGTLKDPYDDFPQYIAINHAYYMLMRVKEYEVFMTQLQENERYTSTYEIKHRGLYFNAATLEVVPCENLLQQAYEVSTKEAFDRTYVLENQEINFLISDDILKIQEAVKRQNNLRLTGCEVKEGKWHVFGENETTEAFETFYDAVCFMAGDFEVADYALVLKRRKAETTKAYNMVKEKIEREIGATKREGIYYFDIPGLKEVLEKIEMAKKLAGEVNAASSEIGIQELQTALIFNDFLKKYQG